MGTCVVLLFSSNEPRMLVPMFLMLTSVNLSSYLRSIVIQMFPRSTPLWLPPKYTRVSLCLFLLSL